MDALTVRRKPRWSWRERKLREFAALRQIVVAMNSQIGDLDKVVHELLTRVCALISANHGSLIIINPVTQALNIVAVVGSDWTPEKQSCSLIVGEGITGRVAANGQPYMCNDTRTDPHYFTLFDNVASELAVPVISQGSIIGVINIDSPELDAFTQEDLDLLTIIAEHAAIAIENTRQFDAARAAREEWRQIFEVMQDAMLICDQNYRIYRVNRSFLEMFKLTAIRLLDQPVEEALKELPAFRHRPDIWEKLHGRDKWEEKVTDSVSRRSFQLSAIRDKLNQRTVTVLTIRETTQEDDLQVRLRQSEKLASMGQMVAGVAHELNNPLQTVLGFAELLSKLPRSAQTNEHIDLIFQEAKRASHIVKMLLLFSRSQPPELNDVMLDDLLLETIQEWQQAYQSYQVSIDVESATRNVNVSVDRFQMTQLIHNVLNNAQQALLSTGPKGSPQIKIRLEAKDGNAIIRFADNGPGIEPEHLNRIFDPFFTTKREGKGTGLGLSLCYSIVRQHQGRIWCESQVGHGATFYVELPIRPHKPVVNAAPVDVKASVEAKRILIIDDELAIGRLIGEILKTENIATDFINDANAALKMVQTISYDLILCDLKMPIMSGKEFYRHLRESKPEMANRIIFATGDVAAEHADLLGELGPQDVLYKPFNSKTLLQRISEKLERLNATPTISAAASDG